MQATESIQALGEQLAANPIDPKYLLTTFGVVGLYVILFAETGLLLGFFLPGDSLLFLAGIAASETGAKIVGAPLSLPALLIGGPIFAILGAQVGHWLGERYGRPFFDKPNSRIFKGVYVDRAEQYFDKFGPARAVVFARFIPIIRTFLNPVAGVLAMPRKKFLIWNVVGAILWVDGIVTAGYLLGGAVDASFPIDKYLVPGIAFIIFLSLVPVLIEYLRNRRERKHERAAGAVEPADTGTVTAQTDRPIEDTPDSTRPVG